MAWTDGAALVVTAAALVSGAAVLASTRRLATALPVLLDMLLAAGVLRLLGQVSWARIASAALVVAVRHTATAGIAAGRAQPAAAHPGTPGGSGPPRPPA